MEYWLAWFGQGNEHTYAVAKAAERMGYTGIALPDHIAVPKQYEAIHPSGRRAIRFDNVYPDALISIAAMAAVTQTLRFMTYVYVLPMRDPFSVAKQAATLAMLSNYRFALGVGAGWNTDEIQLLGHDPHTRGRRMDEMLAIMRDFWDDGVAEFRGEFYDFAAAGQFPVPSQRIPLWIGGKSTAALQRAARSDGWLGMYYPQDEIRTLLGRLAIERQRYLDGGGFDAGFRKFVLTDEVPTPTVCRQLEDIGIDGLVTRVWPIEDPRYSALDPKLEAMRVFAERIGLD